MPKQITKTVYSFQELLDGEKAGTVKAAAVEKARTWLSEGATHFDWWDCTYEWWTKALEQIGFMQPDISFSGFWSQGDGASFTCKRGVDKNTLIEFLTTPIEPSEQVLGGEGDEPEDFRPRIVHNIDGKPNINPQWIDLLTFDLDLSVTRISSHYSHSRTCRFTAEFDGNPDLHGMYRLDSDLGISEAVRIDVLRASLQDAGEQLRFDLCGAIYKDLEEEYNYRTADEQLAEDAEANDYTFDANGRRDG